MRPRVTDRRPVLSSQEAVGYSGARSLQVGTGTLLSPSRPLPTFRRSA